MPGFLLDTNHVSKAVDRNSSVGRRVHEARLAGARLGTCLPVLCEIESGMRHVRNEAKYRRDLNHLLAQLRIWPFDMKTAKLYGDFFVELRKLGRVLSQVDIMIAALARQQKLTILTSDKDFNALPDLRTEDWS